MRRASVAIGQTYNRLTITSFAGKTAAGKLRWKCSCTCGSTTIAIGSSLVSGNTKSCGCLQQEGRVPVHDMRHTPEYSAWANMWSRCANPNNPQFPEYKDRAPPEEWKDFTTFYADLGPKPTSKHSIERINNSKAYGPDNCIWATPTEQTRNRSNTLFLTREGVRKPLAKWAEELKLTYHQLYKRVATTSTEGVIG